MKETAWFKSLIAAWSNIWWQSNVASIATQSGILIDDWLANPLILSNVEIYTRQTEYPRIQELRNIDQVRHALANGRSLQIRNAEKLLPNKSSLLRLASLLQSTLFQRLNSITVFVTPAECQGLPIHHDETEILTIQLLGKKSWTLCLPDKNSKVCVLQPGDLLYIPPRVQHTVVSSEDSISVSAALIFQPLDEADIINAAVELLPKDRVKFPKLGSVVDKESQSGAKKYVLNTIKNLQSLDVEDIVDRLRWNSMEKFQAIRPRFIDVMEVSQCSTSDIFHRIEDAPVEVRYSNDDKYIEVQGENGIFQAPIFLEVEIESAILAYSGITASKLSDRFSIEDAYAILEKLKEIGILEVRQRQTRSSSSGF